jgi:hypothetical protein
MIFSSPDPKGQVSYMYCHHLASVVVVRRKLFQKSSQSDLLQRFLILLTFFSYYPKPAILPYVLFLVTVAMFVGRMEPNEEIL